MLQQREQQFNKVLQEITKLTYHYSQISEIPTTSYEIIAKHFFSLNLAHLELELAYPFSAWLIDKFQSNPPELIKLLSFLQWLKHPIQPHIMGHEPIIHQICLKPNALLILKLLFLSIEPRHYQSEFRQPPYANPMVSEEVFNLLIDNHFKFSCNSHPIFWALQHHDTALLERILKLKPKWVNIQSDAGFTPLMMAIQVKNESGLIKLLEFNPNPRIQNHQKESIAHILYRTQDVDWIKQLTEQPAFSALVIDSMMEHGDINQQIPMFFAISESMIPWIQHQLTKYPQLRAPLYKCYAHAILQNRVTDLDILYHHLRLQFSDQPEILTDLLLKTKETYRYDILSWFLNLGETHLDIRNAMLFFQELDKSSSPKAKTFLESTPIRWEFVPAEICFAISSHLIKRNQSQFIAELQLFHLHPHFHTVISPVTKDKITIVDIVSKTPNLQINPRFSIYFLKYLDQYAANYPRWLAEFHSNFLALISKWSIPKNKLINGSPLIHFIAHEDEINQTQLLAKFINAEVHVNRFDINGKHLFANLLENNPKGFEQIKELHRSFPQFSLENLDVRGSNLLHLSIEVQHIPCIQWCLSQNLSLLDNRLFDQKNAFELAFELQYLDIIDILKKNLKKNQLLPFVNGLMAEHKDDIIEHLFRTPQPFEWQLSEPQIKALKALNHPLIDTHLNEFYLKSTSKNTTNISTTIATVLPSKPKIVDLTLEILMEWIRTANAKSFEKLALPEYQDLLENLFENHFFNIMESVFQSPNKALNKTFIRIPAAIPKIEKHQAWLHLLSLAITTDNQLIFENLLGRQAIFENLQYNIILCIEMSLQQPNKKWLNLLISHFSLSVDQQQLLLNRIMDSENTSALVELLKLESYQNQFIALPIESVHRLLSQDSSISKLLLQFKLVEQYIFQTTPEFLPIEQQQLLLQRIINTRNIPALTAILKHESYQRLLVNLPIEKLCQLISNEQASLPLLLEVDVLREHILQNTSDRISSEHQKFILQRILETLNIPALAMVLKIESFQYHLIESPIDLVLHLIHQDKNIFKLLLQFKPIEQHIIKFASKSLNERQQFILLEHLVKANDLPTLTELLQNELYQEHLIHAPLEVLHDAMNQGIPMIKLFLQFNKIERHIINNAYEILINGLKNRQKNNMSYLLKMSSFRSKLEENPKEFIDQVITLKQMNVLHELWSPYFDLCLILKPYYSTLKMNLPKFIKDAFKMGYSANQALFIFGSTIHYLLENMSFEFLNDIDFISSQPPPPEAFQQSYVQPQLFFTSVPLTPQRHIKFDYFCVPHSIKHFIAEDFQQRDFTVNCLYCDKNGRVFDPTNLGLTDLRHRMIRSVQPSEQSFANDPIRLLRAIKLMIKGFYLFPEVEEAMHQWTPNIENMNFGHIYAIANQMLTSINGPMIMSILLQFNLISKLLRYEADPSYEGVVAFVIAESTRYKNISPKCSPEASASLKK